MNDIIIFDADAGGVNVGLEGETLWTTQTQSMMAV